MKNNKLLKWITTTPVIIYSILLIILPLIYIFIISFFESDNYGGMNITFTLKNYMMLFDFVYLKVFLKSFLIGGITTFICILISYPFSLCLRKQSSKIQKISIILVMVPFIANSLIRTYGWIVLLRKEGVINSFLKSFNLIGESLNLMYNDLGIIVGLVYTLLPFMILPIYSSVSKLNTSVTEASYDLGANKIQTFFRVTIPSIAPGIFSGALLSFTLSMDDVVISYFTSGPESNTLPLYIYSMIKSGITPDVNAMFSIIIFVTLLALTIYSMIIFKKRVRT